MADSCRTSLADQRVSTAPSTVGVAQDAERGLAEAGAVFPRLLITYRQAARICGVSVKSISRAVKRGELRSIQAPGTTGNAGLRLLASDVADRVRTITPPPAPAAEAEDVNQIPCRKNVGNVIDFVLRNRETSASPCPEASDGANATSFPA